MSEEYDGPEQVEALRQALEQLAPFRIDLTDLEFEDTRPLGIGGYSVVRKARLFSTIVAVKELLPGREKSIRMALRFAREMLIWSKLCHDNILPVLKFYLNREAEQAYMISPYVRKGPLTPFLQQPTENLRRVCWLHNLTDGLAYLHNLKPAVVHGDLKPDNLLLKDDDTVVLCDFGVSRLVQQTLPTGLTTSKSLRGSTRWLSPELLQDSSQSLASDVWAWALTALQMLTGKYPYHSTTNEASVLLRIVNGRSPQFAEYEELPRTAKIWALFLSCWTLDPNLRPTATECRSQMDIILLLIDMVAGDQERKALEQWDSLGTKAIFRGTGTKTPSPVLDPPSRPEGPLPSWSDPNSKPPRQPSAPRSKSGCVPCKKHKVKCDEIHPVCGRCNRLERVCAWSDGLMKPKKSERGVSRSAHTKSKKSVSPSHGASEPWRRRSPSGTSTPAASDSDWNSESSVSSASMGGGSQHSELYDQPNVSALNISANIVSQPSVNLYETLPPVQSFAGNRLFHLDDPRQGAYRRPQNREDYESRAGEPNTPLRSPFDDAVPGPSSERRSTHVSRPSPGSHRRTPGQLFSDFGVQLSSDDEYFVSKRNSEGREGRKRGSFEEDGRRSREPHASH